MNGKKTYRYGPHNASQTDKWPSFVTWGSYGMWMWMCYSSNRHITTEKQFWRVCIQCIQSIHKVSFKKGRNPCHGGERSTSCHSYVIPGKEPPYPLNRRLGWSQIWSEHSGEGKNLFLISNFRCVLDVVCFLLGNSSVSEVYMPTFRNTLSVPSSQAGSCV